MGFVHYTSKPITLTWDPQLPILGIGEHIPHAPGLLGAWALVGNVPKSLGTSTGTLELFGSFTSTYFDVLGTYFEQRRHHLFIFLVIHVRLGGWTGWALYSD